jgi:hypothetical protein
MSDTRNIFDEAPDQVESMIRSAGDFIQPSDDLRPRALESASEYCSDQRARRKMVGIAMLCLSLLGLVILRAPDSEALRLRATAPSSAEIQKQASMLESLPHVGSDWGLAEAFTRLRRHQASWLGQSPPLEP